MGPDGYAKDHTPRPGCTCKACEATATDFGNGQEAREETGGAPLHRQHTAREWAAMQEDHEARYVMACEGATMDRASTLTAEAAL